MADGTENQVSDGSSTNSPQGPHAPYLEADTGRVARIVAALRKAHAEQVAAGSTTGMNTGADTAELSDAPAPRRETSGVRPTKPAVPTLRWNPGARYRASRLADHPVAEAPQVVHVPAPPAAVPGPPAPDPAPPGPPALRHFRPRVRSRRPQPSPGVSSAGPPGGPPSSNARSGTPSTGRTCRVMSARRSSPRWSATARAPSRRRASSARSAGRTPPDPVRPAGPSFPSACPALFRIVAISLARSSLFALLRPCPAFVQRRNISLHERARGMGS
jgi:hypothetical protein